jgi:hypothetical protein
MLYSIVEAARMLGGISPWTLRKHIASKGSAGSAGRIRVVRLGRRVFLDESEIARLERDGLPSLSLGTCDDAHVMVGGQEHD